MSLQRTPHPSLIQRLQQLEQKNRQLHAAMKQQQQHIDTIMNRKMIQHNSRDHRIIEINFVFRISFIESWQQHRSEVNELHGTMERQTIFINEQAQRLANSDILVKDLYVENSQLTAAIQRLEQQRSRSNILLQHQGVGGVPGML